MINSVSGVSFKANTPAIDLAAPGKYAIPDQAPDTVEVSGKKKKSKAPAVIGTIAAVAVAAAVTLGILTGKGKLPEKTPEFLKNAGNWLADAGKSSWKFITEKSKSVVDWVKGLGHKKEPLEELVDEIVATTH